MAITDTDELVGKLEISGRPRDLCWGKPWDFIKSLTEIVRVRFPSGKGHALIVSSHETPSPDDVYKLWARFDKNRNPLGWFAHIKGKWRRFYTPAPGEVKWFIGDSANPPEGWQALTADAGGVNASIVAKLVPNYVENPNLPGTYIYFAARYFGY